MTSYFIFYHHNIYNIMYVMLTYVSSCIISSSTYINISYIKQNIIIMFLSLFIWHRKHHHRNNKTISSISYHKQQQHKQRKEEVMCA